VEKGTPWGAAEYRALMGVKGIKTEERSENESEKSRTSGNAYSPGHPLKGQGVEEGVGASKKGMSLGGGQPMPSLPPGESVSRKEVMPRRPRKKEATGRKTCPGEGYAKESRGILK